MPGRSAVKGYTAMAAVERSRALQLAAGTAAGHVDVIDVAAASLSASLLAALTGKVRQYLYPRGMYLLPVAAVSRLPKARPMSTSIHC